MPSPHDPQEVIKALRAAQKEITAMPSPLKSKTVPQAEAEVQTVIPSEVPEDVDAVETPGFLDLEEDEEFDLDRELAKVAELVQADAAAKAQISPEAPAASPEEQLHQQILDTLHGHPNAPSVQQIQTWKDKYGREAVQVLALDADNVYVFTHLTASQWDRVQKLGETIQKQGTVDSEKAMREAIIRAAILWPKLTPEFFQNCRAGLPTTLMEMIMFHSYFMNPSQTLSLTTKL